MNHLSIELPGRVPDSRPGDLIANEDKTAAGGAKVRFGRSAWPFLVGVSRLAESGEHQGSLADQPGFSS